ncbi:heterokaryon incompatibility protein-domain-containing protein [Paraphoma chrysanthemicola]|nr:heterokaryon incompatibility protein-domain-containing protein [Paraphoma chrysanthemicola]
MSDAYQYKRLEAHDSFRLLKISTTSSGTSSSLEYHYSLIHTTLNDAPTYETLSYVWGTTKQDVYLTLVDRSSLLITDTLADILPRIAHHCDTEYIWIDQVCIDQQNLEERGHQVSVMGSIYFNCAQVIVWLDVAGTTGPETRMILEKCSFDMSILPPDLTQLKAHLRSIKYMSTRFDDALYELYRVLACAWFSRAWVFQEVVLAPISKAVISWPFPREESVTSLFELYWIINLVLNTCDFIFKDHTERHMVETRRHILDEMYRQWSQRHLVQEATDRISLARLLSAVTSDAKTSLELDRLYAFFGLNSQPSIVLRPDYKLTFEQALIITVTDIIKGTLRLDIFRFIRGGWRGPSWVPDFGREQQVVPFRPTSAKVKIQLVPKPYLKAESGVIYLWTGCCDTKSLRVHGKIVDTIGDYIPWLGFLDSASSLKASVQSIITHIDAVPTDHLRALGCMEQRVLSALNVGGWCDNTSDILPASSGASPDIEQENGDKTVTMTNRRHWDKLEIESIDRTMLNRQLYTTQQGLFATGTVLKKGDIICIIHGCSHSVALRRTQKDKSKHLVLGTCYLEGWMDPWANGKIYWAEDEADEFVLV